MTDSEGTATIVKFGRIEIRVGRLLGVHSFPQGRHSTHVLRIDFGPALGRKKSLAKMAPNDAGAEVVGRLVLAVVSVQP